MNSNWKPPAAFLLIGLAAGTIIGRFHALRPHGPRNWDDESRYSRMLDRFSYTLSLSAEQKERLASVLEANRKKMRALRAESRPKFEALRSSTREEIRALLTPEQQGKFDAMHERWAARRKRFEQAAPPAGQ